VVNSNKCQTKDCDAHGEKMKTEPARMWMWKRWTRRREDEKTRSQTMRWDDGGE
jgi:hypothetical protein